MAYANGRCIVTKQEGPCLVLPQGSFSPSRITFLSKEGSDKLVQLLKSAEDLKPGFCCINRKDYPKCVVIPRGVINPKLQYLMSTDAIEGMASELAKMPEDITPEEPKVSTAPEPPASDTSNDGSAEGETVPPTEPQQPVLQPDKVVVTGEELKPSGGIPKKYGDPSSGGTIEEQ